MKSEPTRRVWSCTPAPAPKLLLLSTGGMRSLRRSERRNFRRRLVRRSTQVTPGCVYSALAASNRPKSISVGSYGQRDFPIMALRAALVCETLCRGGGPQPVLLGLDQARRMTAPNIDLCSCPSEIALGCMALVSWRNVLTLSDKTGRASAFKIPGGF